MRTNFSIEFPPYGSFFNIDCIVEYCEFYKAGLILENNEYNVLISNFLYKHMGKQGKLTINFYDGDIMTDKIIYSNGFVGSLDFVEFYKQTIHICWKSPNKEIINCENKNNFKSLAKGIQNKILSRIKLNI